MNKDISEKVANILKNYVSSKPEVTAKALRKYWLEFAPNKGIELIKAELREHFEAVGTPVPVLKAIGDELARAARKDVDGFIPLARLLWDEYGREGRIVALIVFGAMELIEPQHLVPMLKELCKRCYSWEDADRLAMDAVEPIVRKYPDKWLNEMVGWLKDENKWVRRASITIIGRLPMKYPAYTSQCLELAEHIIFDTEPDVKKAVSFAIRNCARSDPRLACEFLKKQIPPADPAAVWVLCDVIKSMDRRIISEFASLLPRYRKWSMASDVSSKDKRSIESAIVVLQAQAK